MRNAHTLTQGTEDTVQGRWVVKFHFVLAEFLKEEEAYCCVEIFIQENKFKDL